MRKRTKYALIVAVSAIFSSCVPHWLAPSPQVRLSPEPGVYDEPIFVEPDGDDGDRYFISLDADATRQEFVEFFGEYIRGDVDLRVFVVSSSGVQSEIERVRYVIEGAGPSIDSPSIRQFNVGHFSYDIEWNADAVEDDTTTFEAFEFTIVSSKDGPLQSWTDAKNRGTVEHAWSIYSGIDPALTSTPGPISYTYESAYAGDARWISVFVRDEDGNVASFGSVHMSTWPGPASVYAGYALGDSVFRNSLNPGDTGSPTFTESTGPIPATTDTIGVAIGDVSNDGLADLAAVYESSGTIVAAWIPGNGDGTFAWARRRVLWQESSAIGLPDRDVYVVDLTQDGRNEIVVPTASAGVHVYRPDGSLLTTLDGRAARLEFGDLDGNGAIDVAGLMPGTTAEIRVWLSQDGQFRLVDQLWTPPAGSNNLAVGDLDADGYDDLLIADPVTLTDPSVQIYWGSATGYLKPEPAELWGAEGTFDVAIFDHDGNGTLDLVFGNEWTIGSRIYTNLGGRVFSAGTPKSSSESALQVEVADITGDGALEVIETAPGAIYPIRYFTVSGGTFGPEQGIGSSAPNDIAVGAFR